MTHEHPREGLLVNRAVRLSARMAFQPFHDDECLIRLGRGCRCRCRGRGRPAADASALGPRL